MSYKEKVNLKLYTYENNSFVMQAIIDDYEEISFSDNLYEAGDFTITINYNIPNALKFERGMFIQFGNDPYRFGEIQTITDAIGEDGKGSQVRTITGKDARFIFKRRVIKNLNSQDSWSMTDAGEMCLRSLVQAQCGSGAESKRQLPIVNVIPENPIGDIYSVSESFTNLYDCLVTIATQSKIGWRVKFENGEMTLECYQGTDRSTTVQFSTDFDSLSNGQFKDSSEAYANSVYIGGKGTGADRDIYEGEVKQGDGSDTGFLILEEGTDDKLIVGDGFLVVSPEEEISPSGLDRFEAWDNQSQMTDVNEYEAEAISILTQYGQTLELSGNGLAKCPYIYQEQCFVGDTITVAFSGKSAKVQILSVTEHWNGRGGYGIDFTFGKPQNDLSRQLQLILKNIQKASNKTSTTSSVKWFTIPTDTQMNVSDVVYDTIGFIGDCGEGATFKLYLDSQKTGAKTYHIYFKQLGGGKLTLTTGVAGAKNLVMNSGTYVAIIYVDSAGNVTSECATATNKIETGNTQPATSGAISESLSYEEEETETLTGGTWIDGKPIYRKVLKVTTAFTIVSSGWTDVTSKCGSPTMNIDTLIYGCNNVEMGYLYKIDGSENQIYGARPSGSKSIPVGSYFWFEYTKTTD